MFWWSKSWRRRRILAQAFPSEWLQILTSNVRYYQLLTSSEQTLLQQNVQILVAEKNWEGCGGLTLTDEIKVTIAGQAALLLLGIEHDYFARALSILVYPSGFRPPSEEDDILEESILLGESWYRGPVILSWEQVKFDGEEHRDGYNVVLHEFAHQLDSLNGLMDGTPTLKNHEQYLEWHRVMTAAFEDLRASSESGRATILDDYGATNPAEFFAVATECFFECPVQLQRHDPSMYDLLKAYYGQDPASRFRPRRAQ